MTAFDHLKHQARKWQLAFAFMALVLAVLALIFHSHALFGIDALLYFPVSQLFIAISFELATIGPTTGISVRKTSRFYLYTARVVFAFIALSSLYVLRINIMRVQQAKRNHEIIQSPLVQAIERNDLEQIKRLIAAGADVNDSGISGHTPLMYAVRSHNPDLIRFLIKNGADVNRISRDGHSALFYAELDHNAEAVAVLKEAGATTLGPGESSRVKH